MNPRPFSRHRDGRVELRLTAGEADLLRSLLRQLAERLDEEPVGDLRRLFPPAYEDDPAAEEEFAGLTRDDLREGKRQGLQLVEDSLARSRSRRGMLSVELGEDGQQAWLRALNDLRLVLGTRLDVTEQAYESPPDPSEPTGAAFELYLYLGWLQERLLEELLR